MDKIFVSLPYSHDDPKVVEYRVKQAQEYCAQLLSRGDAPVCPIVIGHTSANVSDAAKVFTNKLEYRDWLNFALSQLTSEIDKIHVLTFGDDDFAESGGVYEEMTKAFTLRIPIDFIERPPYVAPKLIDNDWTAQPYHQNHIDNL